jgi:hypothetical protein
MTRGAESEYGDLFAYAEQRDSDREFFESRTFDPELEEERLRASLDAERAATEPELFEPPEHEDFEQIPLLDIREPWEEHWIGMPEYEQRDLAPWRTIKLHFASKVDMIAFSELIGRELTPRSRSTWFPPVGASVFLNKRWRSDRDDG